MLNVCSIGSGNIIGWTVVGSSPVEGFCGAFMLSRDGALSLSVRGRDSFSRNFTNASAKLSLLYVPPMNQRNLTNEIRKHFPT